MFSDARVVTGNWGKPSYMLAAVVDGDMWARVVTVREQLMRLDCRVAGRRVASTRASVIGVSPSTSSLGPASSETSCATLLRCVGPSSE